MTKYRTIVDRVGGYVIFGVLVWIQTSDIVWGGLTILAFMHVRYEILSAEERIRDEMAS